jgi:hypothetical protein
VVLSSSRHKLLRVGDRQSLGADHFLARRTATPTSLQTSTFVDIIVLFTG